MKLFATICKAITSMSITVKQAWKDKKLLAVGKAVAKSKRLPLKAVMVEVTRAANAQTFSGFGEQLLGKSFYPKQKAVLDALEPLGSFVSFRSCNGGGKTTQVIVTAILAHLTLSGGKVISTSGSWRQIKDQLTPALRVHERSFPTYNFLENRISTTDPNSFWDGFSTNESGKFEGHHGSKQCPLLIVVDEAKTVKDPIFEAIERCRIPREFCRILLASSPGYAQGEFYRSQTTRASMLTHAPIVQRASDCPHIKPDEIQALREKWGPDHPLVRSMIDAEFMPFVEGAIVQLAALDDLLANPPTFVPGERKGFCDFAWSESASGDENVLGFRNGNKITIEAAFRAKGQAAVCAEFIRHFVRLGLRPEEIEGDADGEGANIIKTLHAMGWPIGSAHNGGAPRWNDHYANLAAEMWCDGAQAIIERQFILPDDTDLYGQMLDRKVVPHAKGKLAIESKQAMKDPNREGGSVRCSPDRADAVFGAMARLPSMRPTQLIKSPNQTESPWRSTNSGIIVPSEDYSGERRFFV